MDEFEDELGLTRDELDAWEVPSAPEGFSHEVMRMHERLTGEVPRTARRVSRRWLFAMVASISVAMAGAWLWTVLESEGWLHAEARTTREVGPLVLVAEPGASLDWSVGRRGGHVHQSEGDVFYRVDGPIDLRVETPSGQLEVQGTCFRVRIEDAIETEENEMRRTTAASAAAGIALGALVTVTVYEGRVAFANDAGEVSAEAGEEIIARAGEAPRTRENAGEAAARRSEGSPSERSSASTPAALEGLTPAELRMRIQAMRDRDVAQAAEILRLRSQVESGAEGPLNRRQWYPPSPSELETLAEQCTLRLDLPPVMGLTPGDVGENANALALEPGEEAILNDAISRVHTHFNDQLRALYLDATGTEAGDLSPQAILAELRDKGLPGEAHRVFERIVRERAGLQAPPPEANWSASERAYRAYASVPEEFQAIVAASLGAERAHELRAESGGWPWDRSQFSGCPDE